ncbi:bifunctional 4-hydroxy-2-oxoglutarate aldolase/2-dehydro-3-deoxy-phosphogluconate aldolase [Salinigranum halophilum]|uniref:bifunctional 4-hydroxy-2-oxoglutarate aldolase/2-dehydro-3-deoxy-phosphogluconate aldolase n=1 Tax=Salinigranum halophilum TaxID=2565931 RepID=UPI0010A7A7F3|nr:bifunctional 4-hydroxy-2-oxoglutarate aldolase/2-dehydro-3-deoxy-phosphogluconate aldolase [Salinigranum halophilum]
MSLDKHDAMQRLRASGTVAVMRGADADTLVKTVDALRAGGVTAIEITADNPDALEMIDAVSGSFDDEVIVGAGTVLDGETALDTIRAGAEFVVGPTVELDVVDVCNRYGTLVAPGAFTPTEALTAYEAGADFVKIFPASSGGPGHLGGIKGPLPQIPLMPTGGVDADNAGDFIRAGAEVVGAGSALVPTEAVEVGDFETITENARAFSDAVDAARSA